MRTLKVLFAVAAFFALSGQTIPREAWPPEIMPPSPKGVPTYQLLSQQAWDWGPKGAEGAFYRQQSWLLPTPGSSKLAHAFLFRPPGDGPFRLAVIAHASTENVLRRAQMPQPEYRALAAFLVARGFAVLVPERLGHGVTGGEYLEDQGGCDEADYARSGRATAQEIRKALDYVSGQPFIRKDGAVIIGHSAGGWGAL